VVYFNVEGAIQGREMKYIIPRFKSAASPNVPNMNADYLPLGDTFTIATILDIVLQGGDSWDPLTPTIYYDGDSRPESQGVPGGTNAMGADEK